MNYLCHLYLSEPDAGCRIGVLMGDFVKGPLGEGWPPRFRRGLQLHREVDAFASRQPAFRRSKKRVDARFRCCKPVLIDMFYDHFLARDWERHAPCRLEIFTDETYRLLQGNIDLLPPSLQVIAPRMIAQDWLGSYREIDTIGFVLRRLAQRLRHRNPIADGLPELLRNYEGLREDFEEFLGEAKKVFPSMSETC